MLLLKLIITIVAAVAFALRPFYVALAIAQICWQKSTPLYVRFNPFPSNSN
jgi:hypothetical protein